MTLHPIPSEFPSIRGKFYFLFYQCRVFVWSHHPDRDVFPLLYRHVFPFLSSLSSLTCPAPTLVQRHCSSRRACPCPFSIPIPCSFLSRPCPCSLLVLSLVLSPLHSPYICVSFPISVSVLVLYPSCPVLSSLPSTYICVSFTISVIVLFLYPSFPVPSSPPSPVVFSLSLYECFFSHLCQCPCSLPVMSCPVVFPSHYMIVSFPIFVIVLVVTFPVLSCRLFALSLYLCFFYNFSQCPCSLPVLSCPVLSSFPSPYIFVSFNISVTVLGLKPSSCPVIFALYLKFRCFYYLCHCPLFFNHLVLSCRLCPVFFIFVHFFTVSPK